MSAGKEQTQQAKSRISCVCAISATNHGSRKKCRGFFCPFWEEGMIWLAVKAAVAPLR
jgi:hypothetical protein